MIENWFIKAIDGRYWQYLLGGKTLSAFQKSICLIGYANPLRKKAEPYFFPIISKQTVEFKSADKLNSTIQLSAVNSRDSYVEKVKMLKQYIQKGDVYEINFCMEFYAEQAEIDPVQVYLKLNELTNAPYSSLLRIGEEYIICASPELFLKKTGSELITKPIKGTAPRGKNPEEDERLKEELFNSKKERTENVMAVDVARNDLSVIATRGSVSVNKLYNIESYQTVHQMVSTVKCQLREEISFEDIMQATFPMASMTGAPKVSAMNLIDETEGFERKYYSGAMGRVEENGDFELCVIIRSIFYNERTKRLSIAVGSAITHLSDPEKEYEECLLKANALLKALNAQIAEH